MIKIKYVKTISDAKRSRTITIKKKKKFIFKTNLMFVN